MYGEARLPLVFGIFFALLQNGYGLQCWTCSSDYDVNCRDYFNITKLELYKRYYYPQVVVCQEIGYNYKNVCFKTVSKGAHGIPKVTRGCMSVDKTLNSSECPNGVKDNSSDFCETCESDQCNAAGQTKTNTFLVATIPTLIALFLQI